jgi:hypothetical protein
MLNFHIIFNTLTRRHDTVIIFSVIYVSANLQVKDISREGSLVSLRDEVTIKERPPHYSIELILSTC